MPYDADSGSALAALLAHARKLGADSADASVSHRESLSAEVRLGDLEGVEREEARSIALRAFFGKRQAAASSSDVSDEGLAALAERVIAMARAAPEDAFCGLLAPEHRATVLPDLDTADAARPSAVELEEMARAAEDAARAVAGVTNSGGAEAGWSSGETAYATSDGFAGAHRGTSYSFSVSPLAERDGQKERDYDYDTQRFFADLKSPEAIGRTAGDRVVARLGARKIESTRAGVVFEQRLAGRMLGPLIGAINGAAVARGVSFLKDKLGERIFPEAFSLTEDPLKPRALASRAFDGEGARVRPRALIDAGVLTTWTLNASAARQLGLAPTGHATLGHGGPPGIGVSNLRVAPGADGFDALLAKAKRGLVVTDMFSPSLNMNTGDWSVGVAGFWFEGGAIAHPVSEITVAGNIIDIYARLIAGADSECRGSMETPSLFVDDLAIGGL